MRVNINLATRPYEDVQQFLLRWITIVALIAALTVGLLYYTARSWRESRDVNQQISKLQAEMNRLDREKADGLAMLSRPENRETAEQARFLNNVIVRKAFSWTRAFEDLEKMMPPRIHVVSMTPELDQSNQLQLHMMVAGDLRDRAVELVRRMEESPTFRRAEVKTESAIAPTPGKPDNVQFEITSQYLPSSEPAAAADEKKATDTKEQPKTETTKAAPGAVKQPGAVAKPATPKRVPKAGAPRPAVGQVPASTPKPQTKEPRR